MKTIGIIGGIAPESTVDYYRSLIALYREGRPDGSYPPILINSIDMKKMLDLVSAGNFSGLTEYLAGELEKLARAGAHVGLLASNTPHIVFGDLARRSPIPLISIVQAACEYAKGRRFERLGLFGTRFTMRGNFYADVFSKQGMKIILPEPADQEYIHEKYMGELVKRICI